MINKKPLKRKGYVIRIEKNKYIEATSEREAIDIAADYLDAKDFKFRVISVNKIVEEK
jgi:hypothetical protein